MNYLKKYFSVASITDVWFQETSMKPDLHCNCRGNFWIYQYEKSISCLDTLISIEWHLKIIGMNDKEIKEFNLNHTNRLSKSSYDNA